MTITTSNLADSSIQSAVVKFKLPRSWIAANNIDVATVSLNRYSGGTWSALTTTQTDTDADYIYFSATTPGFSTFAITAQPLSSPIPVVNCTEGAKRCTGSSLETCTSGRWISASCANGCNNSTIACNASGGSQAADYTWVLVIVVVVVVGVVLFFFKDIGKKPWHKK